MKITRKIFLFISVIMTVFVLNGCKLGDSSESSFIEISGQTTVVNNDELSIDVGELSDLSSILNNVVVSENATFKLYKDEEATIENDSNFIEMGQNIYYLKVLAEDNTTYKIYKFIVNRDIIYSITYPSNQGFLIKTNDDSDLIDSVYPGDNISFLVEIQEGYDNEFNVYSNDIIIESSQGLYSITNIQSDIEISVEGVDLLKKNLLFENDIVGYRVLNLDNTVFDMDFVNYGESISFKLEALENYTLEDVVVSYGESVLEDVDGVYLINNVTENVNISIEGVHLSTLNINYPVGIVGYEIIEVVNTINYEDNFQIKIDVDEENGYDSSTLKLVLNDVEIDNFEYLEGIFVYSINQVVENLDVEIEIRRINYEFIFLNQEGYDVIYTDDQGNEVSYIPASNWGDNIYFRIELWESYEGDFNVNDNGFIIDINEENNVYSVINIKENHSLEVTNISIKTYNINFVTPDIGYVFVSNSEETELAEVVNYGEMIIFGVYVLEGYDDVNYKVYINDNLIEKIDGFYYFDSISEDLNIELRDTGKKFLNIQYPVDELYLIDGYSTI